uniref:Uncharacterized protein n=1 Tax=uncultured Armatimonadetes bacterium TaxID=157466 RepID=A0A6J4H657_9BACT|nr:hypothetical protein AVDCRST_MAG63-102 [uncultured Armatimonadetes bacterium]
MASRRTGWNDVLLAPPLRPLGCIALLLFLGVAGVLLLNAPSVKEIKEVYVELECQRLRLPIPARFVFYELKSVRLRGYEGSVQAERVILVPTDGGQAVGHAGQVTLAADTSGGALPSFTITPAGEPGRLEMALGGRDELRVESGPARRSAVLVVDSRRGQGASLFWQVDGFARFEANRVRPPRPGGADEFDVRTAGSMATLQFAAVPGADAATEVSAKLELPATLLPVALVEPYGQTDTVAVKEQALWFADGLQGTIRLDGTDIPLKRRLAEVSIDATEFQIKELLVSRSGGPAGGYALHLTGKGRARSVKEDGRELIPTRLEEILIKPPWQKGLFGLAVVVALFAASIFLKRALEVLANLWMPDG